MFFIMIANILALDEEADYEALNCLPAKNLIRSTKLHLSTEPAFLPNACVCPAWAPNTEGIKIFQRVQVSHKQFGKAC